jgi:hypothetical protein
LLQWVLKEAPNSIEANGILNSNGVDMVVDSVLKYSKCKATIKLSAREEYSNVASIKGSKGTIKVCKSIKF